MKRYIIFICCLSFAGTTFSQIGVNTENVQSNLLIQVDAGQDNPQTGAPSTTQALNDVVVDQSGNLGIGTISPTSKLHIVTGGTSALPNPQLRINDGMAQANKVLMSKADGTANWQVYVPGFEIGTISASGISIATTQSSVFSNTNSYIDLPPGRWYVYFTIGMVCSGTTAAPDYRVWPQATIGDASNMNGKTPDAFTNIRFSNNVIQNMRGLISGWAGINNTGGSAKRYYILAGHVQNGNAALTLNNVMAKNDGFSNLFAFRVKE